MRDLPSSFQTIEEAYEWGRSTYAEWTGLPADSPDVSIRDEESQHPGAPRRNHLVVVTAPPDSSAAKLVSHLAFLIGSTDEGGRLRALRVVLGPDATATIQAGNQQLHLAAQRVRDFSQGNAELPPDLQFDLFGTETGVPPFTRLDLGDTPVPFGGPQQHLVIGTDAIRGREQMAELTWRKG